MYTQLGGNSFDFDFGGDVSWKHLGAMKSTKKPLKWKLCMAPLKGAK